MRRLAAQYRTITLARSLPTDTLLPRSMLRVPLRVFGVPPPVESLLSCPITPPGTPLSLLAPMVGSRRRGATTCSCSTYETGRGCLGLPNQSAAWHSIPVLV